MSKMIEEDGEKVAKLLQSLIVPDEGIVSSFRIAKDYMVFTTFRVIIVDAKGVTGKRRELVSIPYRSIDYWACEAKGNLELGGEFRIFIHGMTEPIVRNFKKQDALYAVQKALANYCK